jgi:hypothetical protein
MPLKSFCYSFRLGQIINDRKMYLFDLFPMYWWSEVPMSHHAESQERQRNHLGEKDSPNVGWNIGKCITNTSDNNIFEPRGLLHKRRTVFSAQ